jgi:hypothetical protein
VIYRRGRSMRVMVYAGRDPLTGKKKWVSRKAGASASEQKDLDRQALSPSSRVV